MLDKYVENDDPAKVRKALLTVAVMTMFFANIQFISNELSILGLRIVLDPARLIAFGRIASALLLSVFLLRSATNLVKAVQELHQRRIDDEKTVKMYCIYAEYDAPPEYDSSPQGELNALEDTFNRRRQRLDRVYSSLSFWSSLCSVISVDYALPVCAGVIAIFFPNAVAELISHLAVDVSN